MSRAQFRYVAPVDFGEMRAVSAAVARMDLAAGSVAVVHDPEFELSYTVGLSDTDGMAELALHGGTERWRKYMLIRLAGSVARNYRSLHAGLVVPLLDGDGRSWFFRMRPMWTRRCPVAYLYRRAAAMMDMVPWEHGDPANVERAHAVAQIRDRSLHVVAADGYSYTVGMTPRGLAELVRPWGSGDQWDADVMLRDIALRSADRGAVPGAHFPHQWSFRHPKVIPVPLGGGEGLPLAADLYGDFVQAIRLDDV